MRVICLCAAVLAAGCLPEIPSFKAKAKPKAKNKATAQQEIINRTRGTDDGEKIVLVIKGKGSTTSRSFTVKGEMRVEFVCRGYRVDSWMFPEMVVDSKWIEFFPKKIKRGRCSLYSANGGTYRMRIWNVSGPWKLTVYKLPGEILD